MRSTVLFSAATLLLAAAAFAQPANDNCGSAQAVTGFGQTNFDTTSATTDGPGGIGCAADTAYNDVWFLWTSDFTGRVSIDLCTTTLHDSVLAVYDGAGCPSGGTIACNDDSCSLQSKVRFSATSGHQYMVRIGGYGATDSGPGVMTIQQYIPVPLAGPIHNDANGHDYYLLPASSWTNAEADAVSLGGHLATIRNEDENIFVYNEVMRFDGPNTRRGWIGLNDFGRTDGDYVWTSGEPVTYTNWGSGEPNHANGTEHYAQIPYWQINWNDNSDLPGDDPCYGIVEIGVTTPACPADLGTAGGLPGQDGVLDNNDFIAFITYFFNSDSHADLGVAGGLPGHDGAYDNNDFIAFINLFFAGCGA
jgi:hypothetical protein